MKVFVDADACPVKDIICRVALKYGIKVVMVASVAHQISQCFGDYEIIQVDSMPQAADMAIINRIKNNDILVTQDYGLAAMALSKKAKALSPRGDIYKTEKIELLLAQRHLHEKIRRAGGRLKGPRPKTNEDNIHFEKNLIFLIDQLNLE